MTRIRKAVATDSEVLTEIAHNAKRYWGYPESWIEHWKADLTITPELISSCEVYVAGSESGLAAEEVAPGNCVDGFYAIGIRGERAELEHMWVKPECIGTGIGKELFMHAMETAAFLNAAALEISSDPNAEGFYKRMGARRIGEISSEVEGQPRTLPRLSIDLDPR
ncbi:MAG: GNAT family N-acetyltransferase [Pyrinomonadaceae bacterium]